MREIFDHAAPGDEAGAQFVVRAVDDRGHGGANHAYTLFHRQTPTGPDQTLIQFQNGPLVEVGPNGVTDAQLLAVLIDRLRGFQAGPFACRENALALTKMEEAMHWIHHRTAQRIRRGVEGTSNA